MQFEMKTLQQNLDKETTERKSAMTQLDARNRKYASIEGAKSEQMKGMSRLDSPIEALVQPYCLYCCVLKKGFFMSWEFEILSQSESESSENQIGLYRELN